MSLKCSIFGHRYGEPTVERDRDESGSEVVITIRETQACDRCGTERVVSENKEVTTLETSDEEPAATGEDATDASPDVPDEVDDLAAVNAAGDDTPSPSTAESTDPETDDGTIIEDSPEQSIVEEAEPDDGTAATAPSGPDQTGSPGDAGAAEDDDAVILEDEPADDEATVDEPAADDDSAGDRNPGAWPDEPTDDSPDWEPPTDADPESPTADEPSPDVEPVGEAVTVPQGTFCCPECGFTTAVESSSLREGDFCPDCHTGTLEHDPTAD